jgi:hypothetical protein
VSASLPTDRVTLASLLADNLTLPDLRNKYARTGAGGSEAFLATLYTDVVVCIRELEDQAHRYHCDDEEKLTNYLAVQLRRLDYSAECEKDQRGHVDLSVQCHACDVAWKAEAKIHKDYGTNEEGLKQLLDRYNSGRDDRAGFLLYLKVKNAVSVVDEWRSRISDTPLCGATRCEDAPNGWLGFVSIHDHSVGRELAVTHFPTHLYYEPTDKSATNAKKSTKTSAGKKKAAKKKAAKKKAAKKKAAKAKPTKRV